MANAPSKQYQHGGGKFNLVLFCHCNCLSLQLLLNLCFWWVLFFLLFSSTTAQHAADCCFLHNPLHFHWYCPSLSSLFLVLVHFCWFLFMVFPPFVPHIMLIFDCCFVAIDPLLPPLSSPLLLILLQLLQIEFFAVPHCCCPLWWRLLPATATNHADCNSFTAVDCCF